MLARDGLAWGGRRAEASRHSDASTGPRLQRPATLDAPAGLRGQRHAGGLGPRATEHLGAPPAARGTWPRTVTELLSGGRHVRDRARSCELLLLVSGQR